jgi:glycosyltransferase involved in cell wall biosynthesis
MKILHVSENLVEGGLERMLHLLCLGLGRRGHENVILHGRREGKDVPPEGVHAVCVDGVTAPQCSNLAARLAGVEEVMRQHAPDVVVMHHVRQPALVEVLRRAAPCVRMVHDVGFVCPEGRKTLRRGTRSGAPELCPHSVGYACQMRAYVHRCMPRHPAKGLPIIARLRRMLALHRGGVHMAVPSRFMRGMLVHNGFDPAAVAVLPHFLPATQTPDGPQGGQHIVFVGRVNKGKGVDVLLDAAARMTLPARVSIVGDGPDLAAMRERAQAVGLGERVVFHGWQERAQVQRVMRGADVVAVPSLCPEAFCLMGLEAMALALPVVAARSGAIPEWLDHGRTGLLVPPGDADALAHALDDMLSDPHRARDMGWAGYYDLVDHFDEGAGITRWERFLRHVSEGTDGQEGG